MTDALIKSYVNHNGKWYYVSTMNRDSGFHLSKRFTETIVWEFDYEKRESGKMLLQDFDDENSIENHQRIVNHIYNTGEIPERNDV